MNVRKGFLSINWKNTKEFLFLLCVVFLIRTFGFGLYQVPSGSMETTMLVGERFFADKFTILFSKPTHGDIIAFNDPSYPYSKNPIKRMWQEYVWGPVNLTKRVIGIPGDELRGTIEDGRPVIYRNGHKLNEPYLNSYPLIYTYSADLKSITPQSYDASQPYNQQPFYTIQSNRIIKNPDGQPIVIYPNTPMHQESGRMPDEFHIKLGADQYWCMGDNRLGSKDCRFFGPISERLIHGKIIFRIWSVDSYESWWIIDLIKHPIDFFNRIRWHRFFQFIT